jgi:hypothetical protein
MGTSWYIVSTCRRNNKLIEQYMDRAKTSRLVDSALRAACTESKLSASEAFTLTVPVGTLIGYAARPLTAEFCQTAMIRNTTSLSWRLGRAVMLANKQANVGQIDQVLIDALGGPTTAKLLFAGKITQVSRRVFKGHTVGDITLAALPADEEEDADSGRPTFEGTVMSRWDTRQIEMVAERQSHSRTRTFLLSTEWETPQRYAQWRSGGNAGG